MGMRMSRRILRVSQKSEAYLLVTSAFERFQGRPRPDISIGAHFYAAPIRNSFRQFKHVDMRRI